LPVRQGRNLSKNLSRAKWLNPTQVSRQRAKWVIPIPVIQRLKWRRLRAHCKLFDVPVQPLNTGYSAIPQASVRWPMRRSSAAPLIKKAGGRRKIID